MVDASGGAGSALPRGHQPARQKRVVLGGDGPGQRARGLPDGAVVREERLTENPDPTGTSTDFLVQRASGFVEWIRR